MLDISEGAGQIQAGRKRDVLLAAVIGFVTLLAYFRTFGFEFVYDDSILIARNPAVLTGGHFWEYFSADAVRGFAVPLAHIYYRPLLLVWWRLNFLLFGLQPQGWHVTAVLLHVLATLLVYAVGRSVRLSRTGAAMAALIFGLHPLHVETAAWVSGAADSLYAIFVLASFLLFLRWFQGAGKINFAGSLLLYAAATLCKETAIVFPAIVFSYGWIEASPRPSPFWKNMWDRCAAGLRAGAGHALVGIGYLGVRRLVLGVFTGNMEDIGWSTIVLTWPKILCFQLMHVVFPVRLSEAYMVRYVSRPSENGFCLPLLALLACALVLYAWQRKADTKMVRMAGVWFLLPLLPTLNLNAFRIGEFVHDRFLYVSVMGMALLVGLAADKLKGWARFATFPFPGAAACVLVGGILFGLTVVQAGVWKNDLTLFSRAYQFSPHSRSASSNLARVLGRQGRLAEAKEVYLRSLQEWPMEWITNYNYGYFSYGNGDMSEAEKYLLRAIEIYPDNDLEHYYLGLTWYKMGLREKAIASVQKAVAINPGAKGYNFTLGFLMREAGNEMGACMAFQKELGLDPANAQAAAQYRRCIQ